MKTEEVAGERVTAATTDDRGIAVGESFKSVDEAMIKAINELAGRGFRRMEVLKIDAEVNAAVGGVIKVTVRGKNSTGLGASESPSVSAVQMAGELEKPLHAPVFLSGLITELEGISFCMDGATHQIHTATGAARLRPKNDVIAVALRRVASSGQRVTVVGQLVTGPECVSVSVFAVVPTADLLEKLFAL